MGWSKKMKSEPLLMSDYFVLNVEAAAFSASAEERLSETAFANGALGISEALPFDQPEGEEDVIARVPKRRSLDVFFSTAPRPEFLQELKALFPGIVIEVKGEANRDWLAEWKKSFQPFALTGDHWVVPSWCEAPPQARHPIRIDPGMAFGTGTHETTRLVAKTLAMLVAEYHPKSCLDVGTGTGILAILARQLGVPIVKATDTDAEARRVAAENFTLNNCADIQLDHHTQLERFSDTYSIVMANIIDGVLVRIQDGLKARVAPGGWLVVSGIISERETEFLNGFKLPAGKRWAIREQQGDWLLFATRL
jgi:ribosomal protein L11 methyltransferase